MGVDRLPELERCSASDLEDFREKSFLKNLPILVSRLVCLMIVKVVVLVDCFRCVLRFNW